MNIERLKRNTAIISRQLQSGNSRPEIRWMIALERSYNRCKKTSKKKRNRIEAIRIKGRAIEEQGNLRKWSGKLLRFLYYTKKVIRQTCYTNCDIIITSSENLFVENFGNYKLIYLSHNACFKCLIDRNKELDMNYILVLIKFGKERAMSLIEDAKNKNPDAFEQLIQPQLQRMYRVAISMLHNEEDAADAIQETVLKCWQKIGQLKK